MGIFLLRQALKQKALRLKWDAMMLKLPVLGKVIRNMNAARFARTMAGLVDSGTPALAALGHKTGRHTLKNMVMREAVSEAAVKVREGAAVSTALRNTKSLPAARRANGGRRRGPAEIMGKMFSKSAEYLEDEFESATDIFLAPS